MGLLSDCVTLKRFFWAQLEIQLSVEYLSLAVCKARKEVLIGRRRHVPCLTRDFPSEDGELLVSVTLLPKLWAGLGLKRISTAM